MHVFIIAAVTTDGFIATTSDQKSTRWTSPEDQKYFTERTKKAGVVVMGATTYATIGHPLPDRLNIVYTKSPKTSTDKNLRYTKLTPKKLIDSLAAEGYQEVAICGGASIYTMFFESGLVNTLYLTAHTNVAFGKGVPLFTKHVTLPKASNMTPLSATTILNEYNY